MAERCWYRCSGSRVHRAGVICQSFDDVQCIVPESSLPQPVSPPSYLAPPGASCLHCPHCMAKAIPLESLRTLDEDVVVSERNMFTAAWAKCEHPASAPVSPPLLPSSACQVRWPGRGRSRLAKA